MGWGWRGVSRIGVRVRGGAAVFVPGVGGGGQVVAMSSKIDLRSGHWGVEIFCSLGFLFLRVGY